MIHCSAELLEFRSSRIDGAATLTIVPSNRSMHSAASTERQDQPLARMALDDLGSLLLHCAVPLPVTYTVRYYEHRSFDRRLVAMADVNPGSRDAGGTGRCPVRRVAGPSAPRPALTDRGDRHRCH